VRFEPTTLAAAELIRIGPWARVALRPWVERFAPLRGGRARKLQLTVARKLQLTVAAGMAAYSATIIYAHQWA
jgi:hypothetical protein